MSYGLFEDISAFDEGTRIAHRKAAAVARKRVRDRFGAFFSNASNPEDLASRLALVQEDFRQAIAEVADEYDVDVDNLQQAILEQVQGEGVTNIDEELADAPSAVGEGTLSSTKEADADRDGGGAVKTENLPTGDETALGGPSPETDHTTWKPNALNDSGNLKPIDAEQSGSPVPTVQQDVTDTPEWENQGAEGDGFLDQTDAVTEQQTLPTADESGQSTERNVEQPHTDTFDNDGQVDPVSSEVFASVDPDKNPLREILESDFPTDSQVEAAIQDFESDVS